MKAYQSGIAKFQQAGAQVLLISTDNLPTLKHWSAEMGITYPLLSDFLRKVSKKYGVLIEDRGFASRTTFVIGKDGRITHIDRGSDAIDPSGALTACRRDRH